MEQKKSQPSTSFSKVIYQVHLWAGVFLGLYILMMSVTGSAIVARRELIPMWIPETVQVVGERMAGEQLDQAVQLAYPDYQVLRIFADDRPFRGFRYSGTPDPNSAAPYQITLERKGKVSDRLFDPFTGKDVGSLDPWTVNTFMWLVDLHADLQAGRTGRAINGAIGLAVVLLFLSGAIVWFKRGRRYLIVHRQGGWQRQTRQLHGMLGFWTFAILMIWAVSGVYLALPTQFFAFMDFLFPAQDDYNLRVDSMTAWLANMHFGRFGGMGIRWTWIILGLAPAILFITGFILWWKTTVKPWRRQILRNQTV